MEPVRVPRATEQDELPAPGPGVAVDNGHRAPERTAGLPLVLVRWHDAWFEFDVDPRGGEDWRADYLVDTVGYLVRQGPTVVSIAQELLPDGDGFRAVTHIPVSTIESITPLSRGLAPRTAGNGHR